MLECKQTGKNKALENLNNPEIQEQLAEILSTYCVDLHDILTIATVHSAGVRPEGLSNEIFSCFHHIARGLCLSDVNPSDELTSARQSHIKRAILDSYKIAINFVLTEDNALRDVLDYLVLAEDFAKYIPDGMSKIHEINKTSREVKILYTKAKQLEAASKFDQAITSYNDALEKGMDLLKQLEVFTKDKVYLLACSREVENKKERRKDRYVVILASIVGACVGAVMTSYYQYNKSQDELETQNIINVQPQQSLKKKQ